MTTLGAQSNAIFRKNAVYQLRAVCTNIWLLLAPLGFCVMLAALQGLVNVVLSGEDFKCGCKCLECEYKGVYNASITTDPSLWGCHGDDYKCRKRDPKQCGIVYSSVEQVPWCPIAHPNIYPSSQQTPNTSDRARPARPATTIVYTAKDDPALKALMAGVVPPLDPAALRTHLGSVLTALYSIPDLSTPQGVQDALFYDGRPLSRAGLLWGTAEIPDVALYRDRVFAAESIMSLRPAGTCATSAPAVNGTYMWEQAELMLDLVYTACPTLPTNLSSQAQRTSFELGAATCLNIAASQAAMLMGSLQVMTAQNSSSGGGGGGGGGGRSMTDSFFSNLPQQIECVDVQTVHTASTKDLNRALFCGYPTARCNGATETNEYMTGVDLSGMDGATLATTFAATIYNNKTQSTDSQGAPIRYQRFVTTLDLLFNSWLRRVTGKTATLLGVQSMPKLTSSLNIDIASSLGPLFFAWVMQLLLPVFLVQLVYEKEKRLRMMMKMHGLGDMAYWLVMYSWYLSLYIIYIIIFLLAGSLTRLNIFILNNYGVQVVHYILFANCNIAFCFLLSCFFSNSRTAVVTGLLYVLATSLICFTLLERFMERNETWMFFVQWLPAIGLYRGIWELAQYAFIGNYRQEIGLTFAKLSDPKNGLPAVWGIFIVEWFIFMGLAWYLEQVLANGTGIRRHPLFFLPSFSKRHVQAGPSNDTVVRVVEEREDVEAERLRVEHLTSFEDTLIVVKDLRKVYPGQDGQPPKVAVQSLTLGIEKGECFGLLGPNGAGKSTSINMMTGFLEPSGGQAILAGFDLQSEIDKIYGIMGVCPQHDLLWDTLTAREHLLFYGRLKGLKGYELFAAVDAALKSVNLFNRGVGNKQSSKYSGGMKRRLSVAISFIGSPAIVYLDEPSTGLDPASRRNLWEVVKGSKRDRAIILTTHSMEEAEVLCDRLGIFVDGRLVCVGNPKEITQRYGGYYVFTLTVEPGSETAAQAFVRQLSPSSNLTYHVGGTLKYEVPASEVSLSTIFNAMQQLKQQVRVLDWGVSNATLEEVFIKFARSIGATAND